VSQRSGSVVLQQLQQRAREEQAEHAEGEEREVAEELRVSRVGPHVPEREHVHDRRHEGDHRAQQHGEAVDVDGGVQEAAAALAGELADGQPADRFDHRPDAEAPGDAPAVDPDDKRRDGHAEGGEGEAGADVPRQRPVEPLAEQQDDR
jgi:hypothetical protein